MSVDDVEGKEFDVFMSHASVDKPVIEGLARRLVAEGLRPFLDKWHLVPGTPWQEALELALDESRTCAVFLGSTLGVIENEEMRAALEERTRNSSFRVIPVLLPDAPEGATFPRFLRRLTWCDFRAGVDDERAFRRLVAGIRGEMPGEDPLTEDLLTAAPSADALASAARASLPAGPDLRRLLAHLGATGWTWRRAGIVDDARTRLLSDDPSPLVLTGLPGAGKTRALASLAADAERELDRMLSVSFVGQSEVQVRRTTERLSAFLDTDIDGDLTALVEAMSERSVLLCVDRIDLAPDAWRDAFAEMTALGGPVRVAATARASDELPLSQLVPVPPLDRDEAIDFTNELARSLDVHVDATDVVARLPRSVWCWPQALRATVSQLVDLPLDVLFAEPLAGDDSGPSQAIAESIAALAAGDLETLALVEAVGESNLLTSLRALGIDAPPGLRASLTRLLSRSLVARRGDGFETAAVVGDGLGTIAPDVRADTASSVLAGFTRATTAGQAADLAPLAASFAAHLAALRRDDDVLRLASDELLALLNTHGHWAEYATVLRIALDAASRTSDDRFISLGLRLARKAPQLGLLDEALAVLDRVEEVAAAAGSSSDVAQAASHRGLLVGLAGDTGAALAHLARSAALHEAAGDNDALLTVDKVTGNMLLRSGDRVGARAAFTRALSRPASEAAWRSRLDATVSLGLCELYDDEDEAAIARLEAALDETEDRRYESGRQLASLHLARAYEKAGRIAEALALLDGVGSSGDNDVVRAAAMVLRRLRPASDRGEE